MADILIIINFGNIIAMNYFISKYLANYLPDWLES